MPPRLLIIADDLTGANDTGVQFAKHGIEVLVSLHPDQCLQAFADDCQVLVANTESRHLSPDEAYRRVYDIARQGVQLGIAQFYKKTDSTLRGNLGSELAALLDATGERELFFAPAYPKLHRTTRGGVQYVNGVPLHQSSFANDPLNPMHEASINALIGEQMRYGEHQQTSSIVTLDAETDEDLQRIANNLKDKTLLAGSAGLAEFLPAAMSLANTSTSPLHLRSPMLAVNGSLHERSLQQIAHAAQQGWEVFEAAPTVTAAQLVAPLRTQPRAILTTSAQHSDPNAINRIAALMAEVLDQIAIPTIAVFGGDTLAAMAQACHWTAFRPRAEFLPGIPLVQVCGREDFVLLTKAGGFGSVDLLSLLRG